MTDGSAVTITPTREDQRIAWLAALAIAIHVLESAVPSPLPGVKPGLANVITVVALTLYGWNTAAWVALLRVVVGSLLIGTFLSPTFALSLAGALASLLALGAARLLLRSQLGALGYSVIAAAAHMLAQFGVAYALFIPHPGLLHLLPVFMTAALIFGTISGLIAAAVLGTLEEAPA